MLPMFFVDENSYAKFVERSLDAILSCRPEVYVNAVGETAQQTKVAKPAVES